MRPNRRGARSLRERLQRGRELDGSTPLTKEALEPRRCVEVLRVGEERASVRVLRSWRISQRGALDPGQLHEQARPLRCRFRQSCASLDDLDLLRGSVEWLQAPLQKDQCLRVLGVCLQVEPNPLAGALRVSLLIVKPRELQGGAGSRLNDRDELLQCADQCGRVSRVAEHAHAELLNLDIFGSKLGCSLGPLERGLDSVRLIVL